MAEEEDVGGEEAEGEDVANFNNFSLIFFSSLHLFFPRRYSVDIL